MTGMMELTFNEELYGTSVRFPDVTSSLLLRERLTGGGFAAGVVVLDSDISVAADKTTLKVPLPWSTMTQGSTFVITTTNSTSGLVYDTVPCSIRVRVRVRD